MMRVGDWLRYLRYRLFYGALLRRGYSLEMLGNPETGCHWYFHPDALGADSVIYTAGVGNDVSFEHGLAAKFGCAIQLIDPSPTGRATMELESNKVPYFRFHPVALAGRDGTIHLAPPGNPEEGSWFMSGESLGSTEVPCVALETLMSRLGNDHIDLLKIDIEGAEYEVLDHLLAKRVHVRQVLVEFHHGMLPGIRRAQTVKMVLRMVMAGYRLLKQDGQNHTFYKPPR